MTFPPEVWDGVLHRLQAELAPISFEMWLPQIIARPDTDGLELVCPTQFHSDRIQDYFLTVIDDCVRAEVGRSVSLRVKVAEPCDAVDTSVETKGEAKGVDAAERVCEASRKVGCSPSRDNEHKTNGPPQQRALARPARPTRRPNGRSRETLSIGKVVEFTMASPPLSTSAPKTQYSQPERVQAIGPNGQRRQPSQSEGSKRQPAFPLTFASFTVGTCNALAREAALALANQRQFGLNQLFIVSDSGLGKTHLSRAVVDTAARAIGDRARYTTAESFTSEFTQALRGNQMPNFKRRYRTHCELLVVEDVQFFEGKAATQLEFFHVVQHVLDCGGRVLLTGDKFPQEMNQLDERIRTRLASGFVAQVDTPDAAVRRNILRAKAAHGGVRLPEDCLDLLVEEVAGNVRELEGALIQLVTMSSLFERPIDLELTHESLQGRSPRTRVIALRATPADIIETVAVFFRTSPATLASRSRRRDVLVPRQLAMYLCRRYTEASLADIGRELNRDHPSVANAIRKVERQLLENVQLRYQAEALIARLTELGHRPLHSFD